MKNVILISLLTLMLVAWTPAKEGGFHDFTMTSIDGKDISMGKYKGKKVLVVNVASK